MSVITNLRGIIVQKLEVRRLKWEVRRWKMEDKNNNPEPSLYFGLLLLYQKNLDDPVSRTKLMPVCYVWHQVLTL